MHASTSPFYPLFASLDVNAKVHAAPGGEVMWDRCIELGIETRKKLRQFARYYQRTGRTAEERWFFDPFVPDLVTLRESRFTDDSWKRGFTNPGYGGGGVRGTRQRPGRVRIGAPGVDRP